MAKAKATKTATKTTPSLGTPPEWMQAAMGASELPEEGGSLGAFPHPLPLVKFNQDRKRALLSEDAENDRYFMPGMSFKRDLVRLIPLAFFPRYEVWVENQPTYVNPTMLGPIPDAPDGGRNVLRLVYMDADTHDVYALDLKNEASIREGKKLQWQMSQDMQADLPYYGFIYQLFTYQGKPNRFGGNPFYPRFLREDDDDPLKKGFKTKWDGEEGPVYSREEVDSDLLEELSEKLNSASDFAVAIKLNSLAGKHAAEVIRKVKSGEMTNEAALKEVPKVEKA